MLNLLVVEDDEVDLMTMKRGLQKADVVHQMTVARDGAEALRVLRDGVMSTARRLIFLDLNMPKMNGLEFLRELRSDSKLSLTPVIVLTTSAEESDRAAAHRLNCAGYFLKPLEFSVFVELLKSINRYWSNAYFAT